MKIFTIFLEITSYQPCKVVSALKSIVMFIALITGQYLVAQEDHLQPMNSALHTSEQEVSYFLDLKMLFYAGEQFLTETSMITTDSWDSESILFLYRNDTFETTRIRQRYFITYKKAEEKVSYLSSLKFQSKGTDNLRIGITEYRCEINTELALKFKRLYKVALLKVSPDLKSIVGNDGTYYYFHTNGLNVRSGMTWSPLGGTKMNELVSINQELISIVKKTKPTEVITVDQVFIKRVDDLIKRIEYQD